MLLSEAVISIFAPHDCLVCTSEGSLLCDGCWPKLGPPPPHRCFKCQELSTNGRTCLGCRDVSSLNRVWVRCYYNNLPKRLVTQLKFARAQAAATLISRAMLEAMAPLPKNTIIVPVPTATSRRRQRGYDQAVLLARAIARDTGFSTEQLLIRHGQTRQVGTKRRERLKQLEGMFEAKSLLPNTHVLLIDDVVTTGATIEAAARELRKAGACHVDALVFAQA